MVFSILLNSPYLAGTGNARDSWLFYLVVIVAVAIILGFIYLLSYIRRRLKKKEEE
jgi:Kef-type K+ transport system membrane component KefB